MKNYIEPNIKVISLSPADILQNSGNDPFLSEISEWDANGALPGLKQ